MPPSAISPSGPRRATSGALCQNSTISATTPSAHNAPMTVSEKPSSRQYSVPKP